MGFTFNDFMHQVVQPVEHVITDPFTQARHTIYKVQHQQSHILSTI